MDIKERLIQFIDFKGITKNKFETICGLPKRYVSNIGNSIQSDVIKKIILSYPEINLYWLITGEGSMLRQGDSVESTNTTIELLKGQIDFLQYQIKQLNDMNLLLAQNQPKNYGFVAAEGDKKGVG